MAEPADLELFTVCPPHGGGFGGPAGTAAGPSAERFARLLDEHCEWAERLGAAAMLIYDFPAALDPFVAAQAVLARTTTVEPIAAVLPALTQPAVAARAVASLAFLGRRRINLNLVQGAKAADLAAHGLPVAGDEERYARMAEFAAALRAVLDGEPFHGVHLRVDTTAPDPPPPAPRLIAPASRTPASRAVLPLLDRALVMAKPLADLEAEHRRLTGWGLRGGLAMIVGVVARDTDAEATADATARYGGTRRDALVRRRFGAAVTSSQHRANLELADRGDPPEGVLWYGAGRVGIDCPKLVGSYDRVAERLGEYAATGVRTVVLDLPDVADEYGHVHQVLDRVRRTAPHPNRPPPNRAPQRPTPQRPTAEV
jgi:alkanesulfonate monooxygenase SsuD/methylene tetrahydromethanopterin reductase-like flavin-dependent oxidoreductase (luciferase family)